MKVIDLWKSMRVLGMDQRVVRVLAENMKLEEIKVYARKCFRKQVFDGHPDKGGDEERAVNLIRESKRAKDVICSQTSTKLFLARADEEFRQVMELLESLI